MYKTVIDEFECPFCKNTHFAKTILRRVGGTIAECDRCAHLSLWPQPADQEIVSWYKQSGLAEAKDYGNALMDNPALRLLERYDPRKGLRVLDVGCGSGTFIRKCSQKGYRVSGTEVSENLVEHLIAEGFEVYNNSIEELKNPVKRYDWVTCLDVIEHVKEPLKAIDNLANLVGPEGKLAIQTPNGNAIALYGENAYGLSVDREHLNYFRPYQLIRLFEDRGFELVCLKYLPRSEGKGRAKVSGKNKCIPNSPYLETGTVQAYAVKTAPKGIRKITRALPPAARGPLRSIAQIARFIFSIDEIITGMAHEFIIIMSRS
ncbi:MAG: class I SAM-dependent methyltransferase [Nitrospirota bacterium]|nr:class I SAM-dependent methyltransferase [Nitrospirota bacterium]